MNEVAKLYENTGIKPKKECYYWDCPYSTGNVAEDIPMNERNCDKCNNPNQEVYPPFTAEKQIAILQLLTQQCDLTISHFTEWEFIHYDGQEPLQITGKDFTETFAKLINAYWQDLTEAEHTQIKNILESEVRE